MTRALAETLLLSSVTMNAALLAFIAGVLRNVMQDMEAVEVKRFAGLLYRHSTKSPFMLTALNLPAIGAAPYFFVYGFENRWITLGFAIWLVAGLAAKWMKLPVYRAIATVDASEIARLQAERRKFNLGNQVQAVLYAVATGIMAVGVVQQAPY